jgi:hypothetical protein
LTQQKTLPEARRFSAVAMSDKPKPRVADAGDQTRRPKNAQRTLRNIHSVTFSTWASSERRLNFHDPRPETGWLLNEFLAFRRICKTDTSGYVFPADLAGEFQYDLPSMRS